MAPTPLLALSPHDLEELAEFVPQAPKRSTFESLASHGTVARVAWAASPGTPARIDANTTGAPRCLLSKGNLELLRVRAVPSRVARLAYDQTGFFDRNGVLILRALQRRGAEGSEASSILADEVTVVASPVAVITLVAPGLAARPGAAAQFLGAFASAKATLIATWQPRPATAISCLVPNDELATTLRAIDKHMGFS